MALAIDASTPARVDKAGTGATAASTASFDPPAAILVICCSGDSDLDQSFTITNNGAALTWNEINRRNPTEVGSGPGNVQSFYAILSSSRTGMTVTATYSQANDTSFKLYVLTGANVSSLIGGSSEGTTTSPTFTTTAYTSTGINSLSFVCFCDYGANTYNTSSDTTMDAGLISTQISYGAGYKSLGASGASVTHNVQITAASVGVNWVTFEILADTGPGYNPPTGMPSDIPVDPSSDARLVAIKSPPTIGLGG